MARPARTTNPRRDISPTLLQPPRSLLARLERQPAATGDEQLAALIDEVASYSVPEPEQDAASEPAAGQMLGPVKVRTPDGELSFFGMFASFDTPFEATTSELAVELLFPADQPTAETLRDLGSGPSRR